MQEIPGSYWARAWGGRVIHLFIGARDTLCGKTLTPHIGDAWGWGGYKRCRHCERLRLAKQEKEE